MLLSAVSQRCVLLRALQACGARVAGGSAPLPGRCCGGHAVWRSFSVHKSMQWHVPGPSSRCLSSSGQSSPEQLIYTGSMGMAVKGVKVFSYSTSGVSAVLMPHILLTTNLGTQSWALQVVFCGIIGFFTFLTPLMLHFVTKGYVLRLYHNPVQDVYTAVTYSIVLREKKTVFHQTQVRLPEISKMFTTFYADKMGLLVNPDLFTVPQDYNHLMGYDKPFDFSPEQLDKS